MIKTIETTISPEHLNDKTLFYHVVATEIGIQQAELKHVEIIKKSLDARKRGNIVYKITATIYTGSSNFTPEEPQKLYKNVENSPEVIIVGAGPAGLFAALRALELRLKPILLERGKDVGERAKDLERTVKNGDINPDSNWCFGEGGAGTYSDGKLYTRSNKRGNVADILAKFVEHGANSGIMAEAHAHIGTNKLPAIISNIRKTITEHGGSYFFNTHVKDFIVKNGEVKGVIDAEGKSFEGVAVVLACGHSAHDIYELFHAKNWALEAKPFALGLRVEHPQELINTIQYKGSNYSKLLPPAAYNLVTQVGDRGVFSFCMCPGGIIVPAATQNGTVVVNGMSNSGRNSPYANAGIAVSVSAADVPEYAEHGSLALLRFQQAMEKRAFDFGGGTQAAPAQRLTDFIKGKYSKALNPTSFFGKCESASLHKLFPPFITAALQQAFLDFDRKMKGFHTSDANLLGIESRTSSPVRIPRTDTYEHIQLHRLYPCGEGAGYAGGIVSSAMDGINCMNSLYENTKK